MFAKCVKIESDEGRFSPWRYSRRVQTTPFEINAHPGYTLLPNVSTRNSFFYHASLPFLRTLCPPRALSGLFEDVPGRVSHQTKRFSPQITLVPTLFDSSLLCLYFLYRLFRNRWQKKSGHASLVESSWLRCQKSKKIRSSWTTDGLERERMDLREKRMTSR